jgi:hypothetical protein
MIEMVGIRLFVDLIAGLSIASFGVMIASLSPSGGLEDRARPAPGLVAVVLLAVSVLLHFTRAGLGWWFAAPWSPRLLYVIWLQAGNAGAMMIIAGWGLLIATRRCHVRREDRIDRLGRWIGGCWLVGALGWWTAWALWG